MARRRPRIGIGSGETFIAEPGVPGVRTMVSFKYFQALQQAGADVLLIPALPAGDEGAWLFEILDGLVLAGGEDVDPRWQGDDPLPRLGSVNLTRDRSELGLARQAWARRFPTLGICRGCQMMTIALGGKVHQDLYHLPGALQHQQKAPRGDTSHRVTLERDSRVAAWVGEHSFYTNSFHHQAVASVPDALAIKGRSGEGVVELVEGTADFVYLGVQWHPEETSPHDEPSRRLFAAFVASCDEQRR